MSFENYLQLPVINREYCNVPIFVPLKYSHTSVVIGFRTPQTLYLSYFEEKNMFQRSALARDWSHLLELA